MVLFQYSKHELIPQKCTYNSSIRRYCLPGSCGSSAARPRTCCGHSHNFRTRSIDKND